MHINIEKTMLFQDLKALLIAAYYMGQSAGLENKMFDHPDCQEERKRILELVLSDELKKPAGIGNK